MIKQIVGRVASEICFFLGDMACRPMNWIDAEWVSNIFYPIYNYLMNSSHQIQSWAGNDKPWGKYEQD